MVVVSVISSEIGSTAKNFSQIVRAWDKYRVEQQRRWSFTDDFMLKVCRLGLSQV